MVVVVGTSTEPPVTIPVPTPIVAGGVQLQVPEPGVHVRVTVLPSQRPPAGIPAIAVGTVFTVSIEDVVQPVPKE